MYVICVILLHEVTINLCKRFLILPSTFAIVNHEMTIISFFINLGLLVHARMFFKHFSYDVDLITVLAMLMNMHLLQVSDTNTAYMVRLFSWLFTSTIIIKILSDKMTPWQKRITVACEALAILSECFAFYIYIHFGVRSILLLPYIFFGVVLHNIIRFGDNSDTVFIVNSLWFIYGLVHSCTICGIIDQLFEWNIFTSLDMFSKSVLLQYIIISDTRNKISFSVANVALDMKEKYPLSVLQALNITDTLNRIIRTYPLSFKTTTHPNAFILFFDIVDYTGLSCRLQSDSLANRMDYIYKKIDLLSINCISLKKVETIGDAYMAISIVKSSQNIQQHIEEVFKFVNAVSNLLKCEGEKVRFGLSFGEVTEKYAGIDVVRSNFFGRTVNVASRMESLSIPFKIRITSEVYEHLTEPLKKLMIKEEVDVKGIGYMVTFISHTELSA